MTITPSPQSVVVPLEDWRHVIGALKNAKARLPMGAAIGNVSDALSKVEHLQAAPTPSSLAGGEVSRAVDHLTKRLNKPGAFHLSDQTSIRAILAALSPEAPSRETEGGAVEFPYQRTFNAISDAVRVEWTNTEVVKPRHGISISVEAFQKSFNASALTPRHEAPASPAWRDEYNRVEAIREAAEGQDRIARSTADPIAKSDAETQAAGHWTRYEREVAKLNAASGHEAPAEGAGEAAIAKLFDAVEMADDYNRLSDRPKRLAKDFLLDSELRDAVSSLRARSSPEAREGEAVAWRWKPSAEATAPFPPPDFWNYGSTPIEGASPGYYVVQPLYTHPAAPSADKLRPTDGDCWWPASCPEESFVNAKFAFDAAIAWVEDGQTEKPERLHRSRSLPDVWAILVKGELALFDTEDEALAALKAEGA